MNKEDTARLKKLAGQLQTATDDDMPKSKIIDEIRDLLAIEFAPEAKLLVEEIEASIPTTQNYYGRYINALSQFKGLYRLGFAKAMLDAGAGPGLKQAHKILGGSQ